MLNLIFKTKLKRQAIYGIIISSIIMAFSITSLILLIPYDKLYFDYYNAIGKEGIVSELDAMVNGHLVSILYGIMLFYSIVGILLSSILLIFSFISFKTINNATNPEMIIKKKGLYIASGVICAVAGFIDNSLFVTNYSVFNVLSIVVFFFAIINLFRMIQGIKLMSFYQRFGNKSENDFIFENVNDPQNEKQETNEDLYGNNNYHAKNDDIIDAEISPSQDNVNKNNIDFDSIYNELANLEKEYKSGNITKETYLNKKEEILSKLRS